MGAGYRMTARGNREAEVLIYEEIGGWFGGVTAKDFYADLRALGAIDTLNVRINSPGGEVFEGLAIYRHLAEHAAKKVVHVDGWACSIASVIAMAGSEIRLSEAGRIMIHNASGGVFGQAQEMREMADRLDSITGSIADVYAARTGQKIEQIRAWMDSTKYFDAKEAMDSGFATSVAENVRIAAFYDPKKHGFLGMVPAGITPSPGPARPERDALAARVAALRSRTTNPAR